jgi:hypothetical protein
VKEEEVVEVEVETKAEAEVVAIVCSIPCFFSHYGTLKQRFQPTQQQRRVA